MGIGALETEADLRAFVQREIGSLPQLVRQLQGELSGSAIRTGRVSLTFTAAPLSGPVFVSHDLGRVPAGVFFGAHDASVIAVASTAVTQAGFTVVGRYLTSTSATVTVDWMVIG